MGSLSLQQHSLCRQYHTDKTVKSSVLHSPEDISTIPPLWEKQNKTTPHKTNKQNPSKNNNKTPTHTYTSKKDLSLNSKRTQFKADHPVLIIKKTSKRTYLKWNSLEFIYYKIHDLLKSLNRIVFLLVHNCF